jgi:F-type H+-transporting ATPase subunit b
VSSTTFLLAATEGGHSNPLLPEVNELIWGAISFAIFFLVMAKVVFPSVNRILSERSESIEGNLEKAAAEREQSQALLRQYEQKLQDAHGEARKIVDQARSNADQLESELRAKAEEEARRIVERARVAIDAERERAIAELRQEVGQLAVDVAAKIVGNSLDRDRHLQLVDQYVSELQGQANN